MNKKLTIIGPILNQNEHKKNQAASMATSEFIRNLIISLESNFVVTLMNFSPDRTFPLGNIFPVNEKIYENQLNSNYINIPFFKNLSLSLSLLVTSVKNQIVNKPKYIIFYNWHWYYVLVYIYYRAFGKLIYVYAADYKVPYFVKSIIDINYQMHLKNKKDLKNTCYFPGPTINNPILNEPNFEDKDFSIGYAGSYGKSSSIKELIDWFIKKNNPNKSIKLRLYGKVPKFIGSYLLSEIKNIEIMGYMEEPYFSESLMRNQFLIEYRNKKIRSYNFTFPSKLLLYRKFNSIILTNTTEPLDSTFSKCFVFLDDYNKVLDSIVAIPNYNFKCLVHNHRKIFFNHQINLSAKLLEFIENGNK